MDTHISVGNKASKHHFYECSKYDTRGQGLPALKILLQT